MAASISTSGSLTHTVNSAKHVRNIYQPVSCIGGQYLFPPVLWSVTSLNLRHVVLEEERDFGARENTGETAAELINGRAPLLLSYHPSTPYVFKYGFTLSLPKPDILFYMESFFGHSMVDRTGTLVRCAKAKILDPLPSFDPSFNMSIADACLHRAKEIYRRAMAEQRQIRVLWSGGIDSTVALVALLRVIPEPFHKLITIYYTKESLDEYKMFFFIYILKKLRAQRIQNLNNVYKRDESEPGFLLVTGELGDQIFGSSHVKYCFEREQVLRKRNLFSGQMNKDWCTFMPHMLISYGALPPNAGKAWLQWIEPQVAHSPIPIQTVFDMLWWINFSLKWQHITLRLLCRQPKPDREMYSITEHFFRSENFQQWSYHNHSRKLSDPNDWKTYKMELKNFIYDFTDDAKYRDEKLKEPSLKMTNAVVFNPKTASNLPRGIGLDENFERISFGKHSTSINVFREKYGSRLQETLTEDQCVAQQSVSGPDWISKDIARFVREALSPRGKRKSLQLKRENSTEARESPEEIASYWAFNFKRNKSGMFGETMNGPKELRTEFHDDEFHEHRVIIHEQVKSSGVTAESASNQVRLV